LNSFDLAVFAALIVAVVAGFVSGLLRAAITILAYLFAAPIAMLATSFVLWIGGEAAAPLAQNWMLFFAAFLSIGVILGKLACAVLDGVVGAETGIADRFGGAALGILRVILITTTLVVVFDQLVPPARQPEFLNGSQLRPLFSMVGQNGLTSLPPDIAETLNCLKTKPGI
jgi:membrane protein required for colicin V production